MLLYPVKVWERPLKVGLKAGHSPAVGLLGPGILQVDLRGVDLGQQLPHLGPEETQSRELMDTQSADLRAVAQPDYL